MTNPPRAAHATGTLERRRAGVLLHPTSLPGAARDGALGATARHFVDWLAVGGFGVWQLLPLGPVGPDRSPYFARSNHAGNPELVDLGALAENGLVEPGAWRASGGADARQAHAAALAAATRRLLASRGELRDTFDAFRARESHWLEDYALYTAIQARESGRPWWDWPAPLRLREPDALAAARTALAADIDAIAAGQCFFHEQWRELREYANARGVRLFGDVPIYVAPDSVEVWAHRELFQLGADCLPTAVAGVPPDYFSKDGQFWGNPLYRWEEHERTDFAWWRERLRAQFALYDLVRIDHFRGLEAYWAVPANAPTAATGEWRRAPGGALLARVRREFGRLEVVAEDLGLITPEVERLRDDFALPGMRVLQFGFDGSADNVHVPFRWTELTVGYTGTHDNDTTRGWFESLGAAERERVLDYLGTSAEHVVHALIRLALASVARLAIVPMQDLLGLDSQARMNTPGTTAANWAWGFEWEQVSPRLGDRCRRWNELYGRL